MESISKYVKLDKKEENELRNNFYNHLKNGKFKDLCDQIDATDDIKMKYTSLIEDASIEFSNCSNCKGLANCKNKISGFMYTPIVNNKTISFDYVACKYKNKEINDNKYLENIELFQISESLKRANIKDVYTNDKARIDIIKYFKDFIDNYGKNKVLGLYLNGSFGTGKTYLVAALFNEMAKREVRSAIVYYPEFLRSLKESFDTDYKDKFNYIRRVPLLLIDDIGAESVTAWSRDEILGSILQYRMEEHLPTFFTSNLTIEELEEHLSNSNRGIERVKSRRIIERIKYITKDLKLVSTNLRGK